ncbi:hypothetical protein QYM36_001957 [Artemia franciscana]|uniref:Uncharacterized protein n=1 Tax=Artemia franciscana TaxID=6661 RepID=A0AA88LIW9_ARTSF|nr:hypothetical protein QYM36_001957 [Artemia franciscana]
MIYDEKPPSRWKIIEGRKALIKYFYEDVEHYALLRVITTCLLGVLRSLDESSVKSAAVLCITYLLQGQGSSALEVLKDSIGEIHRELRRLLATEKDNQLIMHTNLALDELDTIMKSFLDLSQQPMKKEIFISSLPK